MVTKYLAQTLELIACNPAWQIAPDRFVLWQVLVERAGCGCAFVRKVAPLARALNAPTRKLIETSNQITVERLCFINNLEL